jgi:kinesin family protein 5
MKGTPCKGTPTRRVGTPKQGTPHKRKLEQGTEALLQTARKSKRRGSMGGGKRKSLEGAKKTLRAENASNASVQVFARFRPQNKMEREAKSTDCVTLGEKTVDVRKSDNSVAQYEFNRVFNEEASQEAVYKDSVQEIVAATLEGFSGTVIAYGQTGSGKTHTMDAVIQKAAAQIIAEQESSPDVKCEMKATMVEIYNETVNDLQDSTKKDLKLFTEKEGSEEKCVVGKLTETPVSSIDDINRVINAGMKNRATDATAMNATSSRSHSIFTLKIVRTDAEGIVKTGKLTLVDLAGSECAAQTQASGQRAKEAAGINKSLLTLQMVVKLVAEKSNSKLPLRDSKLTRILSDAFGGNSRTALLIALSPAELNRDQTISTLKFGSQASKVVNNAAAAKGQTKEALAAQVEYYKNQVQLTKHRFSDSQMELKAHATEQRFETFKHDAMETQAKQALVIQEKEEAAERAMAEQKADSSAREECLTQELQDSR